MDRDSQPERAAPGLVIFRVAQEALTNVTRHAKARTVELSVLRGPSMVSLRVCDNGNGVAAGTVGTGIQGMRERAMLVGGQLSVATRTHGGTEVRLDLPLDKAAR